MPEIRTRTADWLRVGIDLFAQNGMKGLLVEALAEKVASDNTGFCAHFKDEQDFFWQMLQYWRRVKTTGPIETFAKVPVEYRIEKLVDVVFADRTLHDFLFYLRQVAAEDKKVNTLLKEIEEERIESTRHIFNGLGFGLKEIDLKVEILYSFYLGWYERYKHQKFTLALRSQVLDQIGHLVGVGN